MIGGNRSVISSESNVAVISRRVNLVRFIVFSVAKKRTRPGFSRPRPICTHTRFLSVSVDYCFGITSLFKLSFAVPPKNHFNI